MSNTENAAGNPASEVTAEAEITLGVVGLGNMGAPLARRLTAKGFNLQVADPNPQTIQFYIMEGGANPAATPMHLAQMSNVIVMAMPDDASLRDAVTGPNGIEHGVKPGTVVVDMSDTDPETGMALGRALVPRGALWVEVVLIGTPKQAAAGRLTVLAGGQSEPVTRVTPVLNALAEKVILTGSIGSAALAKSLAGFLSASNLAATVEALIIGKCFGLEPAAALSAIRAAAPLAGSLLSLPVDQILSPRSNSGYTLTRAIADIDRARAVAQRNGIPAPLSAALREICMAAKLNLDGSDELNALARWMERVAKTELGPALSD